MLRRVNEERSRVGARPLTLDPRLMRAAQLHSEYQASIGDMTHDGMGGMGARIQAQGYRFSSAAENVAWGYSSVQAVMNGWMNSQGHRENLLNSRYTHMGWGRAGDNYWTQVFASPL
jgi:uncharacterized protein YkwD